MSSDNSEPTCNYTKRTKGWSMVLQVCSIIIGVIGGIGVVVSAVSIVLVSTNQVEINFALGQPGTSEPETTATPSHPISTATPTPTPEVTPPITTTPVPTATPTPTVDPTPTGTLSQGEFEIDDPILFYSGDTGAWCLPSSSASDTGNEEDFWFTWAKGQNEDGYDARAEWRFKNPGGKYRVEAWIPSQWAMATVMYKIYDDKNGDAEFKQDEIINRVILNQSEVNGWQLLGDFEFSGQALIEVENSDTPNDYREDGTVASRIAVDAIKLTLLDPAGSTDVTTSAEPIDAEVDG